MKAIMLTLLIWDLPTRLFHWLLAACVAGLVITGNVGGDAMVWHFRLGYAVLSLLLFRFVWGFVGGHWSRWSQLPLSPAQVMAYWRGRASSDKTAGHNPMGSWSVLALLWMLAIQVATGLISDDEIAYSGPLTSFVAGGWVNVATSWHKHWGKLLLILLVVTHLAAIAWYTWRKQKPLVPAMWHGHKVLSEPVPASRDSFSSRLLAFAVFALSIGLVLWIVSLGS
jgi:cytochrome b